MDHETSGKSPSLWERVQLPFSYINRLTSLEIFFHFGVAYIKTFNNISFFDRNRKTIKKREERTDKEI